MMPSPSKRTLTETTQATLAASSAHRNDLVPADICLALQNVGSRVRKNVMEGYATDRCNASVPATPHSSPAKQPLTPSSNNPIFRSANDTLYDVLSSPSRSIFTPSPSPRKRGRAEMGSELDPGVRSDVDSDSEMNGFMSDPEDEEVLFVLGPASKSTLGRPTKPLRRSKAGSKETSFGSVDLTMGADANVRLTLPTSDSMDEDYEWFSKSYT